MRTLALWVAVVAALVIGAADAVAHGLLVTGPGGGRTPPTARSSLSLREHTVEAELENQVASVKVRQVFRNHVGRQLEGTYLFPLPEGAVVSDFAMTMGGKLVKGEIIRADRARAVYESIVRRRRDPGLLEYVGRGLFRASVFPIPPNGDLTIELTYQQTLPEDAGTIEMRYPLATGRLHGQPVSQVVVDVRIRGDVDLKAIYSPSHEIAIHRDDERKARVSFEAKGGRQDADFLLYVGRSTDRLGVSLQSHKPVGDRGTFMAVFAPSNDVADGERVPKDVVYVLDTSGSMNNDGKIDQARNALRHGIHRLNAGDRFNIVGFSAGVSVFRERLVDVSDASKEAAGAWLAGLQARGGTDIEGGMRRALPMGAKGRLFMLVLLTDGRPTVGVRGTAQLVDIVKQANVSNARVFTFGVGHDLDVRLLDRIAEVTEGARDYVAPREDIEIVTSRFFTKVDQPVLENVTVAFGDGVEDFYPRKLGDVFAGGQVMVLGRFKTPGEREIRLKGTRAGKPVELVYPVTLSDKETAAYLPRLWAHRKVAFLLDEIRLHGEDKELKDEVIRLATEFGIVTPYTSGLVVEDSELEAARIADLGGRRPRGPTGTLPSPFAPSVREPTDPTPPPPPPPSGPPTTPTPLTPTTPATSGMRPPSRPAPSPTTASKSLRDRKGKQHGRSDDVANRDGSRVKTAADKTFVLTGERWVDTAIEKHRKQAKAKLDVIAIEPFSDALMELAAKNEKIAKYLALGEGVSFLWEGKIYEVAEAKTRDE